MIMPKKSTTIKQIIIDTLGEAFFMPLLFLLAVNALKEKIDALPDDEAIRLSKEAENLIKSKLFGIFS